MRYLVLLLTLVLPLALMTPGVAQNGGTEPPTRVQMQTAIDALASAPGLDDDMRGRVTGVYQEALEALDRASEASSRKATFNLEASDAPIKLEEIRRKLASPSTPPVLDLPSDATLATLETGLTQASADLAAARAAVEELQAESGVRSRRNAEIPSELAQARDALRELDDDLSAESAESEPSALTAARRALIRSQRLAFQSKIAALEAEVASYEARRELLPARRDRTKRRVDELEALTKVWQTAVNNRRDFKAQEDAREATRLRREAAGQHAALKDFAAENERLAALRTGASGLATLIRETSTTTANMRAQETNLRTGFRSIRRRIDASGLNRATGLLLRRERESLPDVTALNRQLRATNSNLEDAEYELIEREESRAGAGDIDRVVRELLTAVGESNNATDRVDVESVARELAVARRDLLDQLVAESERYRNELVDLDLATRGLLITTEAYETFIEERILWVRSYAPGRVLQLADFRVAVPLLLERAAWSTTMTNAWTALRARWLLPSVLGLGVLVAFHFGARARKRMRSIAKLVASYRTDTFQHTISALLLTIVKALPIPLLLLWLAWLLGRAPAQPVVALAAVIALRAAGVFLFILLFIRGVFHPCGLAHAHFRWHEDALAVVRRELRWGIPTLLPLVAIVVGLDWHGDDVANASVGRLAFTLALAALCVLVFRLLRPGGPALRGFLARHQSGLINRLRYAWFPLGMIIPIVLIVAAWDGYYYTALRIQRSFDQTILLTFVLAVAQGILLRWLFVARREVAIEDAKRRREQARAESAGDEGETTGSALLPIDEDKLDLPAISSQTRQLFRTAIFLTAVIGLFMIWADTLPALRMLDRIEVWPRLAIHDADDVGNQPMLESAPAEATPSSPSATSTTVAPIQAISPVTSITGGDAPSDATASEALSVTLHDVGLALLLLIATSVAFRNLPGLVEITVLKRLPLDTGSRYALSTVLRYAIAIVGVVVALGAVGITWGRVQWLAAALTFGLAFGLQEIFANFVSGLIILGERPFRLGDTITAGQVTGTVTRIKMRATTIADWDRKELVIPNKTFITGEVINWSLNDPVLRVKVPVGVSYGSDVDLVTSILLRVAKEEPNVLEDPGPTALFLGFGDSTLNFELRVFIPNIDHFVAIRHHLHMAIIKEFRAEKIEIAFPQRDLHVRSIGDLSKLVERRENVPARETV